MTVFGERCPVPANGGSVLLSSSSGGGGGFAKRPESNALSVSKITQRAGKIRRKRGGLRVKACNIIIVQTRPQADTSYALILAIDRQKASLVPSKTAGQTNLYGLTKKPGHSSAGPFRFALLKERTDPLRSIGTKHILRYGVARQLVGLRHARFKLLVK